MRFFNLKVMEATCLDDKMRMINVEISTFDWDYSGLAYNSLFKK